MSMLKLSKSKLFFLNPSLPFHLYFWHSNENMVEYLISFKIPHLDLEERQISEDLDVVGIPPQRVPVTLDRFVVLLIGSLKKI